MRHIFLPLLATAATCWVAGCTQPQEPPPFQPVAGVKLLMVSVIEPAADTLWGAVGTVMTLEGSQETKPTSDQDWALVRNAAVVLAESGNLLMMERRAIDQGEWLQWSKALVEAGQTALQAADAQDVDGVFAVGEQVYNACSGCHQKYWTEGNPDLP